MADKMAPWWTEWVAGGGLRRMMPAGFPIVVTLCGSTRFGDAYRDASRSETLAGRIVLSVGLLGHAEGIDMSGPLKGMLDELHLRKIDLADEILVLNVKAPFCPRCEEHSMRETGCRGGCAWDGTMRPYIGESTRREIAYARATNKVVRFLEPEAGGP